MDTSEQETQFQSVKKLLDQFSSLGVWILLGAFLLATACLSVWMLAGISGLGFAAAKQPEPRAGFRPLFNAKDLSGWHKNHKPLWHGTGGRWTIEENAIVGEQDPPNSGNGGLLLTNESFGDFEVTFEVKPDWGVDSGFFVRSTENGECYQIMIDYYDSGNIGEVFVEGLETTSRRTFQIEGVYEDATKRRLASTRALRAEASAKRQHPRFKLSDWTGLWKIEAWNAVQARIAGNPPTITTYLNGQLIGQFKSESKFEGTLESRGALALQVHGGKSSWPKGAKVRFRNIQVKTL
ncbi:MAG: DUF1080 domain-containing protein [Acidobacteria bacterium]|nr:DUF1080 domain-containing protein [Acidobacteriota bacterium]